MSLAQPYRWKWTCPECGRLYAATPGGIGYRSSVKLRRLAIDHYIREHGKRGRKWAIGNPDVRPEKMGQVRLT